MRASLALLLALAACATTQPSPAEKTATSEYCNPCTLPCLSDLDCTRTVAAGIPAPVDPCAPGQAHTPDQCPGLDDDGDTVANADDRCPLDSGILETSGCPPTDSDEDGIADHLDRCLMVKGIAEAYGCPPPDTDLDGIADAQDRCPDQPGVPAEGGCPPALAQVDTAAGKIDIKEKVFFDTGKATIQARSFDLLDDVAALLVANTSLSSVVVEGHTDSRGSEEANRRLAQARAEAVKAYLVGRNVDPSRLEARGIGEDRPAAPNTTPAGREANRRVEFQIAKGE